MFNQLTNRLQHGLYVISKNRKSSSTFLPLYQSAVFKSTSPLTQPSPSMTSSRTKRPLSATSSCFPPC